MDGKCNNNDSRYLAFRAVPRKRLAALLSPHTFVTLTRSSPSTDWASLRTVHLCIHRNFCNSNRWVSIPVRHPRDCVSGKAYRLVNQIRLLGKVTSSSSLRSPGEITCYPCRRPRRQVEVVMSTGVYCRTWNWLASVKLASSGAQADIRIPALSLRLSPLHGDNG